MAKTKDKVQESTSGHKSDNAPTMVGVGSEITESARKIRYGTVGRKVRIEPSPFKQVSLKLKMSQAKVNSAGYAVVDSMGDIQKADVDLDSMDGSTLQVPGTAKTIAAPMTPSGIRTGLTIMVDNPYLDEVVYHPTWGEKVLKGKEKALLQHVLEYKHGKDFNYYTGALFDRVSPSDKLSELPFFLTPQSKIILTGNVTFLDLGNPLHEVNYYTLRAHPICANSYADLDGGRNIDAFYYIVDEEEVADAKAEKLRIEQNISAAMRELDRAGGNILVSMSLVLGNDDRNPSQGNALRWVDNYCKDKTNNTNASTFMKWFDIYKEPASRDRFFATAELQEFVNHGTIRTKDHKYYWVKPETDEAPVRHFEWPSKEKVVNDFILNPAFQEEYNLMKSIHESRTK